MQRAGLYSLFGILVFALLFALLPGSASPEAQTGAKLQGVKLTLYPVRDPDAIWRFSASDVTNDPTTSTTVLKGLSDGVRMLREKNPAGQYTGQETRDAILSTPELEINGQDDLITPKAKMTLIKECADITMEGDDKQKVKIEQGFGFSAPLALVDSPSLSGKVVDMRMDFQMNLVHSDEKSNLNYDINSTESCENGQRVKNAP